MQPLLKRTSARSRTRDDVYSHIRASDGLTRPGLVELMGMSPSTIGHAVAQLIGEGRVIESPAEHKGPRSGSGRPPTVLRVAPSGHTVAAIDFGHSRIRIAVAGPRGDIVEETTFDLDVDLKAVEALDLAADQLASMRARHDINDLGLVVAGIPGPVDRGTELVCSPTILSGWVGLAPKQELERRLGTPVHIENDAVLGAWGERIRGAGREHTDFMYIKVSHGIGAGLIVGGEIYRGATGLAGEIGHIPLDGQTERCRCGRRGCLESVVSVTTLREQVLHSHPAAPSGEFRFQDYDDSITRRILDEAGRALGRVLADLCNLMNPSAVVLGGILGTSAPPILDGVRESINRHAQPATAAAIEVLPTALDGRAELLGGLEMAGRLQVRLSS